MHINDVLKAAVERKASDVHIKVGAHVVLRVDGKLQVLTEFKRLYIAGTDQGFLGIVGAMLSGISIANKHVLMAGG